ncbi:LysR family transcriptional regulator [Facilibium subflavum]|uniref:LysR family transcriptional regulator n=1 Tax=Facilibium subflavum TaxID=2219058 RepID=UPI000E64EF85|nr:LysR family transcriptional regulator [Facilibium subflavum]
MKAHFSLKQVEVFIALVEIKNFTRTAEKLYMTQPGVSAQLRNLEAQIGVSLVKISGQKLIITDTGIGLYKHFLKIKSDIETTRQYIDDVKGVITGDIRIGLPSSVSAQQIVFKNLQDFIESHPKVNFAFEVHDRRQLYEKLENGELDIIFAGRVKPEYYQVAIEKIPVYVAISNHENATDYPESLTAITDKTLILPDPDTEIFNLWPKEAMAKNNTIYFNNGNLVEQAIQQGLGIGLITGDTMIKQNLAQIVPMKEFPRYLNFHLACLKGFEQNPAINALEKFLRPIETL